MQGETTPEAQAVARLEEILREEIALCESLAGCQELARGGLEQLDPGAVRRAARARRTAVQRIDALEREAAGLRAGFEVPPPSLEPDRRRLEKLTLALTAPPRELHSLADQALGRIRRGLREILDGRHVLRGYRGAHATTPRFTDRRG